MYRLSVVRNARALVSALWEAPQTALGAVVFALSRATGRAERVVRARGRLFVEVRGFAVSLGAFVFWSREHTTRFFHIDGENRAHEYGHTFQSRLLGPLYLPLVGIPSVSRNVYAVGYGLVTGKRWLGYFDGYPERWADRLGGVDRVAAKRTWPLP